MAKIIKRRRKLRIEAIARIMLTLALLSSLASSLYINTQNASLTMEIQNMNNQVAKLKTANMNLNIEIQTLQNKERVYVIAQDAGLFQNQDNIISVKVD